MHAGLPRTDRSGIACWRELRGGPQGGGRARSIQPVPRVRRENPRAGRPRRHEPVPDLAIAQTRTTHCPLVQPDARAIRRCGLPHRQRRHSGHRAARVGVDRSRVPQGRCTRLHTPECRDTGLADHRKLRPQRRTLHHGWPSRLPRAAQVRTWCRLYRRLHGGHQDSAEHGPLDAARPGHRIRPELRARLHADPYSARDRRHQAAGHDGSCDCGCHRCEQPRGAQSRSAHHVDCADHPQPDGGHLRQYHACRSRCDADRNGVPGDDGTSLHRSDEGDAPAARRESHGANAVLRGGRGDMPVSSRADRRIFRQCVRI